VKSIGAPLFYDGFQLFVSESEQEAAFTEIVHPKEQDAKG
jgi:hypothetical protein